MSSGPTLVASPDELAARARRIGAEISAAHPAGVCLVGVLKGSVVFLADLCRHLSVPASVDFVAVAPFDGVEARTQVVKDLERPVTGLDVVLVTSIVDTGLTVDFLTRHLAETAPASLTVATLVDRPSRRLLPVVPAHVGVTVADGHLFGAGLDLDGRYRNVRGLWSAQPGDPPDTEHLDALLRRGDERSGRR